MLNDIFYSLGKADAISLRSRASTMTGTAIIDEEAKVPDFDPTKDYSFWPTGSPVRDEDQIWTLIQPYNVASTQGRPSELRALWGLCHTKNPERAKPWVAPLGISGVYQKDECYTDGEHIYKCLQASTVYDAKAMPSYWEVVK